MKESAVPLVDVPAASVTDRELPELHYDGETSLLSVRFPGVPVLELEDTLDELTDLLGFDQSDAIRVVFSGAGVTAATVQRTLRFVTRDCDRPIQGVSLSAECRDALLREAVGRDFESIPAATAGFAEPPARTLGALPPLAVVPVEVEAVEQTAPHADSTASDPTGPASMPAGEDGQAPVAEAVGAIGLESVESVAKEAVVAEAAGAPALETQVELPFAAEVAAEADTASVDSFLDDEELPHSRPWGTSEDGDRRVLVLRRTVRSGKSVRFSGDVVLFGDVNAGAQVIADGDIVVLGRLRGLAHAGSRGDSSSVVVGLDMQSGQVRIGDAIAFPQQSDQTDEPAATSRLNTLLRRASPLPQRFVSPSVARVVDGQIRIEDYHGRLHA